MARRGKSCSEGDVLTVERTASKTRRPPLFKVLLHNDDYTPMDFVVHVLTSIFRQSHPEAVQVMLSVHKRGVGVAGTYPYEIAETKVHQVHTLAEQNEYPLKCSLEKA